MAEQDSQSDSVSDKQLCIAYDGDAYHCGMTTAIIRTTLDLMKVWTIKCGSSKYVYLIINQCAEMGDHVWNYDFGAAPRVCFDTGNIQLYIEILDATIADDELGKK